MPEQSNYISPVIAKIDAKGRVLDFRDGLSLASSNDFAMIHGAGGAKHARVSCIKMVACDYSAGKGDKSVTVSANISVGVARKLYEIAKQRLVAPPVYSQALEITQQGKTAAEAAYKKCRKAYGSLQAAIKSGQTNALTDVLNEIAAAGSQANSAYTAITAKPVPAAQVEHEEVKVNPYAPKNEKGKSYVTQLQISRQGFTKNGEPRNYTWFITITNGYANETKQALGGVSYDASSFEKTAEVQMTASDYDFFRVMSSVNAYISLFEQTYGLSLLAQGRAAIDAQIQERMATRNPRD